MAGFAPAKVRHDLGLGQQLTVNLTLPVGGVAKTVQVTADSPLIAIKQSARTANDPRRGDQEAPKGRDFVADHPGARSEHGGQAGGEGSAGRS